MKLLTKLIIVSAPVVAIIGVAIYTFSDATNGKDTDPGQVRIGKALKQAIAVLDALPPVAPLVARVETVQTSLPFEEFIAQSARVRQGDISQIRRDFPSVLQRFESAAASEADVLRIFSAAVGPHQKALPALDKWVAEEPNSYAALMARGTVLHKLGWHQRGGEYIPYTPKENLQEMTRLHILAADDFVSALSKTRYPIMAVAELIGIAMANGWKEESKKLFLAGERLYPASDSLFESYAPILYTEWGTGSVPAAQAFLRRAEENGVSLEARSHMARHLQRIEKYGHRAVPDGEWLARAVSFSEQHNTVSAWSERASVEKGQGRFEDALESLRRVAARTPNSVDVMTDIAEVLQNLNRPDDFKLAMRRAADLGSDWAQGEIIYDMIWQRKGEKRDWDKIRVECEASAEMLNRSGQNCVGGLYSDGLAGYPKDDSKAIVYFALAARQGHYQAQHDYGWMLINGMSVKADREKGLFYMRNSARQQFQPALNKLQQLGERTDNLEWKLTPLEDARRKFDRLRDRGAAWLGRY